MFDECTSPLCTNPIGTDSGNTWRRTPKKFCSDDCKGDMWALRKAAHLLSSVTPEKRLEILESVSSRTNGSEPTHNQGEINMDHQREIKVRRYRCERWPRLGIGGKVRFRNGLFETDDPELIALVESNIAYGAQILQVGGPQG